jgi:hypothetical protein
MGFVSEATFRFLRENIRKRVDHALESGRHTVRGLARIAHLDPDIVRDRDDLIGGIYLELTTELQELVTKLGLHEKDRLWETYDRKNAEAEFRQSVALPMAVLTVIAAWIETPWILLGLVVPAVFLVQGLRRGQEARSEVYLAVVQNVIHSYVLDRVGEVPDEGGAEAPGGPAGTESGTPTRPDSPDRGTDKEPADVGGAAPGQRGGGPAVPVARGHRESADSPEVESHRGSPRP